MPVKSAAAIFATIYATATVSRAGRTETIAKRRGGPHAPCLVFTLFSVERSGTATVRLMFTTARGMLAVTTTTTLTGRGIRTMEETGTGTTAATVIMIAAETMTNAEGAATQVAAITMEATTPATIHVAELSKEITTPGLSSLGLK